MTHTFSPRKALFLAVLLASTFTFTPIARAQVVSESATQAQVQELQNTLVALLTQLIAQLQAQITELIAQQASQATQLGSVQSQVDKVVVNTTTVPAPTPVPLQVPFQEKTKRQNCEPQIVLDYTYTASLDSARNERADKNDVLSGYWDAARLAQSYCAANGSARSEGCQKFVSDNAPFLACMAN